MLGLNNKSNSKNEQWNFTTRASDDQQFAAKPELIEPIHWNAQEFSHSKKNNSQFILQIAGALLILALVYIISDDTISTIAVAALISSLLYISTKHPRELQYSITAEGIQVGQKFYKFSDFKSFTESHDPNLFGITLLPTKRLMIPLTIPLTEEVVDAAVRALTKVLPYDEKSTDTIERIARKLKF